MNSTGRIFRLSIFGESHGKSVGVVIDGCPAGVDIHEDDFNEDLNRRKSGAKGTTPRLEADAPMIKSGVFKGKTTGAPILVQFENTNTKSEDYYSLRDIPRPGHADFVAMKKYGNHQDYRGGGHFSGRITLGIVAAGVVAKKIIQPLTVSARLIAAGGNKDIEQSVEAALEAGDSIGGLIECQAVNMPVGLGEPFFDSVEAVLSHNLFSIPAIKGVEFGSGFQAAEMNGSEHNDEMINDKGTTETNYAGGIVGGISNGNDLVFRVAVKPPSSIGIPQYTYNIKTGKRETLEVKGRHDACIALRLPVVVEAATAITLADFMLLEQNKPRAMR
jgi:chorismate synthase